MFGMEAAPLTSQLATAAFCSKQAELGLHRGRVHNRRIGHVDLQRFLARVTYKVIVIRVSVWFMLVHYMSWTLRVIEILQIKWKKKLFVMNNYSVFIYDELMA
jgi:hypothetical protein